MSGMKTLVNAVLEEGLAKAQVFKDASAYFLRLSGITWREIFCFCLRHRYSRSSVPTACRPGARETLHPVAESSLASHDGVV